MTKPAFLLPVLLPMALVAATPAAAACLSKAGPKEGQPMHVIVPHGERAAWQARGYTAETCPDAEQLKRRTEALCRVAPLMKPDMRALFAQHHGADPDTLCAAGRRAVAEAEAAK